MVSRTPNVFVKSVSRSFSRDSVDVTRSHLSTRIILNSRKEKKRKKGRRKEGSANRKIRTVIHGKTNIVAILFSHTEITIKEKYGGGALSIPFRGHTTPPAAATLYRRNERRNTTPLEVERYPYQKEKEKRVRMRA
uniref:Uncharacterized protein n=1 Tax=Trypanosoma congolense (strain IL3000) TaxID=1068625 RepID=G0UZA5_TRYCI|nr:hypothetical protein, unlikely [Trypanosoma congolense IL3000]